MKIGYMAFIKCMTVNELMLRTILQTYDQRNLAGQIEDPWPKTLKKTIKQIMNAEFKTMKDMALDYMDKSES